MADGTLIKSGMERVIAIGASAGGVEALTTLVKGLPASLPAAVLVVMHTSAQSANALSEILTRSGPLPAQNAVDGEVIRPGRIYVAVADHHLVIEEGDRIRTARGPKENRFRPAVDPLFRSAALAYGPRAIGVVLTGWLDDGTAGLWAIKDRGGLAIVQDPQDALAPAMPLNALKHVKVDHSVPVRAIAPLLAQLTQVPAKKRNGSPMSKEMDDEVKVAAEDNVLAIRRKAWGELSMFACPECHGVLSQITEGSILRFRCHTGHAYSVEALLSEFAEKTEENLWNVVRSMDETVMLLERMASQLDRHEHQAAAQDLRGKAQIARRRSDAVRRVLTEEHGLSDRKKA